MRCNNPGDSLVYRAITVLYTCGLGTCNSDGDLLPVSAQFDQWAARSLTAKYKTYPVLHHQLLSEIQLGSNNSI